MMFRFLVMIAAALASVAANAAEPLWRAAETKHFVIYSKSPDQRVQELATDLEKYDKLLRMATAIDEDVKPVKVRIYEVQDMSDVQAALGLDYTTGVGGFYSSNSLGPFLVTPRKTGLEAEHFTPEIVRRHEYAHHFMLEYFPASYPSWYVEGFAELIGSSKLMDDGRIGYGTPALTRGHDIARSDSWVPLQELLTNESVKYLDTYAQGWAVTHFLTFNKERSAQFRQYLAALTAGKSFAEAAKVFGDLNDLDREARRYVTAGSFEYRPVTVDIQTPVITSVRPLSAGEAALIPEVIAYDSDDLRTIKKQGIREHQQARRERNLQNIREKASRYPNDPFALRFLSEAEFASGNYAQATSAADRLLAIQPNNVDGLARKSLAMSKGLRSLGETAEAQAARDLAVKANKLDHDDPLPLLAYYESFHEAGVKAPKLAVEGLMQAVSTLPADTNARELLVDELASEHRWDEAMAWLAPIANDPHDSPLRDSARDKMKWLMDQMAKERPARKPAA